MTSVRPPRATRSGSPGSTASVEVSSEAAEAGATAARCQVCVSFFSQAKRPPRANIVASDSMRPPASRGRKSLCHAFFGPRRRRRSLLANFPGYRERANTRTRVTPEAPEWFSDGSRRPGGGPRFPYDHHPHPRRLGVRGLGLPVRVDRRSIGLVHDEGHRADASAGIQVHYPHTRRRPALPRDLCHPHPDDHSVV